MRYKLYKKSFKAWDAMLEAIDQAQKSIYLEMYIFLDDTSKSHDFIGRLQKKASRGLQVIVVADAFGSANIKKETVAKIKSAGIEFIFYSHWLRHIHRKILIVDERIAFIGGVNIGKSFSNWNDLQLRLTGRIVKPILKSFAYTYWMANGKDQRILEYRKRTFTAKFKFWIMEHSPIRNVYSLKEQYREKISQAKHSIQIVTPYFTPPRWLGALLDSAVQRGVRVEILVPQKTDLPVIDRVNHNYIYKLSFLGIKFFLTNKMLHAKMLVIDNEIGLIGSQNIDYLSFQINTEAGIFFTEKNLIEELQQIIEEWKSDAIEFKSQKYKLRFWDYIILASMKMLHPIL